MRRILVIECNAFPNLRRGDPNDGIRGGIIFGISAKYFNPKPSLVDVVLFSCQGPFGHKAQECREPLAVAEVGICQESLQLTSDGALLRLAQRYVFFAR